MRKVTAIREVGGCFFWGSGYLCGKLQKLEIKEPKDLVSVYAKHVQSRVPPSPILINQFLFVKGVMISASSGSLGLGAVTVKEKRWIRTLTKTRQHPTNVMAWCYGDILASNYVLSGGNCGCQMNHPLTLKARGLERGEMK